MVNCTVNQSLRNNSSMYCDKVITLGQYTETVSNYTGVKFSYYHTTEFY